MQINITGHGIQLTPALRDYANEKLTRLKRHSDNITSINLILDIEKLQQIAKATVHIPGVELHAHSESSDLYSAIDTLIDKLDNQIKKHKEKIKNHHHRENNALHEINEDDTNI